MKRILIVGALAALVFGSVWAEDAASDFDSLAAAPAADASNDTAAFDWGTLKWSGDQNFSWRWGAAENPTRTGGLVDGELTGEYKWNDLKVTGAAAVKNGEYTPGETLVTWAPGTFKVSAGLSEFSWGVADANNPTDTLNSRDYRFGASAERIVNPAVTTAWYPADWVSLEAVFEPWKEAPKFPTDFGASVRSSFASYGTVVTVSDDAKDGSKPVYAGRANFFLQGLDLSFSYVYDRDSYYTPVITTVAVPASGNAYLPSKIELVRKTVQRVGVNAKTTVDRFGLWFEGAYNITEDPTSTDYAIRDNKLAWTTGFDFNWGPGSAYYVNLQYAGSWIPGYDSSAVSALGSGVFVKATAEKYYYRKLLNSLGSETEEWLHGATYSLKFPLNDATITPTLSGAVMVPFGYDNSEKTRIASAYFKPELDVMPADGVHLLFGAELSYGWIKKAGSEDVTLDTSTDKLGIYTPQNAVYIKVNYKWNGSLSAK